MTGVLTRGGRDLDLSQGAAEYLGLTRAGVDWVDYTVTGRGGYGAGHSDGYGADRSAAPSRGTRDHVRPSGHRYDPGPTDVGGESYYVVRPGDTMWGISAQLGTTVPRLASANGITNPDEISVGQRIYY